jgi:hypothetical protein
MADPDNTGAVEGLCQNCLRVRSFGCYEVAAAAVCPGCGGGMCPCDGCKTTIARLRDGERDPAHLGLLSPIAGWTEQDGATEPEGVA